MNRRPSGLQLSKALVGFLQYKAAEGLSSTTLISYEGHLKLWMSYAGDVVEINEVTAQDLRAYLAWLRTDYKPRRLTGGDQPLCSRERQSTRFPKRMSKPCSRHASSPGRQTPLTADVSRCGGPLPGATRRSS